MNHRTVLNLATGQTHEEDLSSEEIASREADEAVRLRAQEEADRARYRELRAAAFAQEADALFFQEQRGEVPAGTWAAKVDEIRARFPSGAQS